MACYTLKTLLFLLLWISSSWCSAFVPHCHNQQYRNVSRRLKPVSRSVAHVEKKSTATTTRRDASYVVQTAFQTTGVQKVLELGVVAWIGMALRDKLDAKAITALLLNALVPAVIVSSLSTLTLSAEMGLVLLSGVALTLIQLASGELAARFVVALDNGNGEKNEETSIIQRTAAIQLGTMAPALSVFSFTREFVGASYAGFAALADVPTKLYTLLLIPYYLRFRGAGSDAAVSIGDNDTESTKNGLVAIAQHLAKLFSDPFNLAISSGLVLASLGRPVSSLGFAGKAVGGLVQAQTAILFLLIGLKLKFGGDRPKLCLRLLLARHGFCSLAVSAFLGLFLGAADSAPRLAAVLSSHAACSIIAFGQISKVVTEGGVKGYDTDLAFDLVALSFPFTVMLNTVACLAGSTYVNMLPVIGGAFLALSAIIGKFS